MASLADIITSIPGLNNGITLVAIAVIIFVAAYFVCGRWIARNLGINTNAPTPAYRFRDGLDYVPASRVTVLVRHFSAIAGAGAIAGPILAIQFGWLPVFLWILIGSVFIGAAQDFIALYASIRNEGKSMSRIIEHYIGNKGRKFFLLFSWLFQILLIAAFSDIIATAFDGFMPSGARVFANASAGCISILYILMAMGFGTFTHFVKPSDGVKVLIGLIIIIGMVLFGLHFPLYFTVDTWRVVIFNYCFVSAVLPTWLMTQPRDYLSFFLLLGLLFGGLVSIFVGNATLSVPAFRGSVIDGQPMFPILFVTVSCGAVSGFHSLVSSRTSSKVIANERDILPVGYGCMLFEGFLGILVLAVVCMAGKVSMATTPFQTFSWGAGGFLVLFDFFGANISKDVAVCLMKVCATGLAMTTIDSVSRISRMTLQEFFEQEPGQNQSKFAAFMSDEYIATSITLVFAYLLCLSGYQNIWVLFGSANQMLSTIVIAVLLVFLRETGRKSWILYGPGLFMLGTSVSALLLVLWELFKKVADGHFSVVEDGLSATVLLILLIVGLNVVCSALREYFTGKRAAQRKEQLATLLNDYSTRTYSGYNH